MHRCCFLTLEDPGDFVIDDEVALSALERAGWPTTILPWRQRQIDWNRFDVVVVRSTWDYWDDVDGFLAVLDDIERRTLLANPLSLVRWNLAKTYLRELEAAGVVVVPTRWHETLDRTGLEEAVEAYGGAALVVKPQVGGNGEGVVRVPPDLPAELTARVLGRYGAEPCMVQPFRSGVTRSGEASLFFFDGEPSHAIAKYPAAGEFRSQEERGARIEALVPSLALLDAGRRAMAALPETPLYARADLLAHPRRGYELVELELIEPSLYFRTDPAAPAAFAGALARWVAAHKRG